MYIENRTENVIAQVVSSPSGLNHRLVLQPFARAEIGSKDGVPVWAIEGFKQSIIGQRAMAEKQVVISDGKKPAKKTAKPKPDTETETEMETGA